MPAGAAVFGPGLTLVGHGGAGRAQPPVPANTPASCLLAARLGVAWVEVDVRQAADGAIVAWHDELLAGGVAAGSLPGARLAADHGIWELGRLLEALPPGLGVDLDVKNRVDDAARAPADTTAGRVARIAARAASERPLLLTSFDPALPTLVRPLAPGLPLGLLTWAGVPLRESIPTARHLGFDVLAPHVGALLPGVTPPAALRRQVAIAHRVGLRLLAWVAQPADLPWLRRLGVDAACVDDIPAARAALA